MTSFTTASGSTPLRATYRSDGLRGWKQVSSGNRYFFLYDGDQIVCGFNGNGDLSRINVWGASGLIGRQSGTNGGTPVYDYAWDDKGNISQVLNTNSSVASNYLVSAWGEASTDSAAYDPYRCMGGEFGNYFDAETGLVLCGQRYYDPSGGRWINRDPISYNGGLNVYGYCGNNPTNFVDNSGAQRRSCAEIVEEIGHAINDLDKEWGKYSPEEDAKGNHPYRGQGKRGSMSGEKLPDLTKPYGHYKEIASQQNRLRKLLNEYNANGCGNRPNGIRYGYWAYELANQRIPAVGKHIPSLGPRPAPVAYPYSPSPSNRPLYDANGQKEFGKGLAKGTVAAGIAFLVGIGVAVALG